MIIRRNNFEKASVNFMIKCSPESHWIEMLGEASRLLQELHYLVFLPPESIQERLIMTWKSSRAWDVYLIFVIQCIIPGNWEQDFDWKLFIFFMSSVVIIVFFLQTFDGRMIFCLWPGRVMHKHGGNCIWLCVNLCVCR